MTELIYSVWNLVSNYKGTRSTRPYKTTHANTRTHRITHTNIGTHTNTSHINTCQHRTTDTNTGHKHRTNTNTRPTQTQAQYKHRHTTNTIQTPAQHKHRHNTNTSTTRNMHSSFNVFHNRPWDWKKWMRLNETKCTRAIKPKTESQNVEQPYHMPFLCSHRTLNTAHSAWKYIAHTATTKKTNNERSEYKADWT